MLEVNKHIRMPAALSICLLLFCFATPFFWHSFFATHALAEGSNAAFAFCMITSPFYIVGSVALEHANSSEIEKTLLAIGAVNVLFYSIIGLLFYALLRGRRQAAIRKDPVSK